MRNKEMKFAALLRNILLQASCDVVPVSLSCVCESESGCCVGFKEVVIISFATSDASRSSCRAGGRRKTLKVHLCQPYSCFGRCLGCFGLIVTVGSVIVSMAEIHVVNSSTRHIVVIVVLVSFVGVLSFAHTRRSVRGDRFACP